jgi:c-di-GMP phosphodiesterase
MPSPARDSVVLARQPILDGDLRVCGYELLFRALDPSEPWDDCRATARVLVGALGDIGLQALVGPHRAYVNVDRAFLLEHDPLPFDGRSLGLELLEDQLLDHALLERLRRLVAQGHELVLDDYAFRPGDEPLLQLASTVKLDVRAHPPAELARQVALLRGHDVTLLAEKVEDEAEFEACRRLGFTRFQGFFFSRPCLVHGRETPQGVAGGLRTTAALSRSDLGFDELQEIVLTDPGLALRLLRLLNSAAIPTAREITSIPEALRMLGAETVRQWARLFALAGVRTRCDELIPTALVRARALQALAPSLAADPDTAFAVGLFSVSDALLGISLAEALRDLPLADEVLDALLEHRGPLGWALGSILVLEAGERPSGDLGELPAAYSDALVWSRATAVTLAA